MFDEFGNLRKFQTFLGYEVAALISTCIYLYKKVLFSALLSHEPPPPCPYFRIIYKKSRGEVVVWIFILFVFYFRMLSNLEYDNRRRKKNKCL